MSGTSLQNESAAFEQLNDRIRHVIVFADAAHRAAEEALAELKLIEQRGDDPLASRRAQSGGA
jgi:hypothetical protein